MIILLILFILFCLFMAFYTANLNKKAKNQNANSATNSDAKNSSNSNQQARDKKFIWIFIIVLEVVLIGVNVIGALHNWGFWPTFIVSIIGMAIVFFIFNYIKNSACPKCGKKLSMREISRKTVSSYTTTIDVERKVINNKGEIIHTYTEAVPATHYIYECVDECKFCGHRQEVRREATHRD